MDAPVLETSPTQYDLHVVCRLLSHMIRHQYKILAIEWTTTLYQLVLSEFSTGQSLYLSSLAYPGTAHTI